MNDSIRVLHTEWSDGWGGQEIRILNEMLAVRERGVEIYLACRENARIQEKALEQGIPVFTLPFRGNADLKTLFGLMRIIRRKKIDIVNTHSGKDTWVGGLAAKLTGRKFIRTRHLSNPINPSRLNFINEIAALNSLYAMFIGVDTAVMHIAAANDVPVLAFFGPSGAFHWGPWDNALGESGYARRNGIQRMGKHTVYALDWECIPCGQDGCEGTKISDCLMKLSTGTIHQLIEEKLS